MHPLISAVLLVSVFGMNLAQADWFNCETETPDAALVLNSDDGAAKYGVLAGYEPTGQHSDDQPIYRRRGAWETKATYVDGNSPRGTFRVEFAARGFSATVECPRGNDGDCEGHARLTDADGKSVRLPALVCYATEFPWGFVGDEK